MRIGIKDWALIHIAGRARSFSAAMLGFVFLTEMFSGSLLHAASYTTNTIQFSSYKSRTALLNGGWSFWATNATGGGRNTEITDPKVGAVIAYNPSDDPGTVRIPVDSGFLLLTPNDSRNCLFRSLPTNWVSMRLKLSFAPKQSFQEANIMLYQDDDDFVWMGHSFSGNERVRFGREFTGLLLENVYQVNVLSTPATNMFLRLDRDPVTDRVSGLYSNDGDSWTNVGSFSQSFPNPRLGIYAGGSPGGFPNCDLIRLEVVTLNNPVTPAFVVPSQRIVFNMIAGQPCTNLQALNVALQSQQSAPVNWTLTNSAPTWFLTSTTSGTTPASCDVSLKPATTNLAPGTYQGTLGFRASGLTTVNVNVTLIVTPAARARVSTWQDGKRGAMTVSTDDSKTSPFYELVANGFQGSFMLMESDQSPVFAELYQAGMELGAHTLTHPCVDVGAPTMRGEIEANMAGIFATTPIPQSQLISLAWPCGVATIPYQIVASDYFLCARGYNFNQLEEATPYDFMNLKNYNSHENAPFPPADLKTVVDAAELQGKWFNLVLHNYTNDDGAIDYAATKDIWVAPMGTVTKYILQRDRTVITNYSETSGRIQFNSYRLPLNSSSYRSFETAFGTNDVLTFKVDITGISTVSAVFVGGVEIPFTTSGNTLLFKTVVTTNSQAIVLDLTSNTPPVLPAQAPRTVNELTMLTVNNAATDADSPAQTLTYALAVTNAFDGTVVTNAQISNVGIITWTPPEALGPGNYIFTTVATDFATPPLSATNSFTVTVNEINMPPVLPAQADQTVIGSATMTVINTATDPDLPVNSLSYALTVTNLGDDSAVLNAAIDVNGIITWTPTSGQATTTNRFTTVVTDTNPSAFNSQHLSATNTFIVVARLYPLALPTQADRSVNELTTLRVTNTTQVVAADLLGGWLGTNIITFDYTNRDALLADGWSFLATSPSGVPRDTEVTNASVGLISYAQTNDVLGTVMRVPCDTGDLWSSLNDTTNHIFRALPTNWISTRLRLSFATAQNYMQAHLVLYQDDDNYLEVGRGHNGNDKIFFVQEIAGAPTVLASPDVTGTELSLRLDRDVSSGDISAFYSLNGTDWVSLGQANPALANARLGIWTGASTSPYSSTQFRCDFSRLDIVTTNTTVALDYTLAVTNTADNSVVTNANIDPDGVIVWTPNEAQGPGVYSFTTVVTDGTFPAQNTFTVTVNEVNTAPLLTVPGNTNISGLVAWSAQAVAADGDLPANALTFALVSGPAGLTVTADGLIAWTPGMNQGHSTNLVRLSVTDNSPLAVNATSLSVTSSFTIAVSPVLTVTANNANRTYGVANPAFTASYAGFVNGDNPSVLQGSLHFNTPATSGSSVGSYPIQVSGVSSTNYEIIFVNGQLTITKSNAAVSLGNLSAVYNGLGHAASAITVPAGLSVNLTYAGSVNAPTNAGSYEVIGTISDINYAGAATNTLVIANSNAVVTLGNLNAIYNGAGHSASASTVPVGLAVNFTYDGQTAAPTNAGSYEVIGKISEANYAGAATNMLVIAKSNAPITLGDLSQVYDGTARVVSASTVPPGLTVNLTYAGNASAPTNAGSYEVIGTINDVNYTGAATNTLVVIDPSPIILSLTAASPTAVVISWNSLSNQTYRLQYKNSLSDDEWIYLPPDFTATGSTTVMTNSVGGQPQRFYRVQKVP